MGLVEDDYIVMHLSFRLMLLQIMIVMSYLCGPFRYDYEMYEKRCSGG